MSNPVCPSCSGAVDAVTGVCPRCATQTHPSSGSDAPTVEEPTALPEIPGYRIHGRLGEGGMGAVYLAEETALARRVAIKVISRRVASDAQSKARFLREARTLATIEHPHVVRVYSFGEVDGQPYLVMEYVDGETLADRMARAGRLGVDEAIRITRDIVDALDAAWEHKVVHRDIKPSNILIDRRGRVRVADFGLAKPISFDEKDVSLTLSGYMVGTPHYVSPEQAQGHEADYRSDFYSLGVLLYHMLTGERPFEGPTPFAIVAKHVATPMPSPRARRSEVPEPLDRLTQALSRKKPEERPASHAQVLAALDAMIVRTPSAPMPSFAALPIVPQRRTWSQRAAAVALVLVIVAAGFVLVTRVRSKPQRDAIRITAPFVVAVTPFYGPDEDSAKEGRVMAAMIERAIVQRLGSKNARVVGIEETKNAVRSDDEARELAARLSANAVIWGEAFALRTETEIQPHVTLIAAREEEPSPADVSNDAVPLRSNRIDPMAALDDAGSGTTLKLQAAAPDQIELRKTSASGVGDLVLVLAGIHALENERDPRKALRLFEQTRESAETLRYRVQALLEIEDGENALRLLERAVALDPANAASQAILGDLRIASGRASEAIDAYRAAAATGQPYTTARGILFEGRLYRAETYRGHLERKETQTNYLLAVDPGTGRVAERHALPGVPTRFRIEQGTLVIDFPITNGRTLSAPAEIRLRGGRFDRPLWSTTRLYERVRSARAGWGPVGNFLEDFEKPLADDHSPAAFRLRRTRRDERLPMTLPDVERALRAAAEQDPTQPWTLFFLAMTLREQKRVTEANAIIDQLARRDDPGVPYYEFARMLSFAVRMRAREWEAPLWSKVVVQRRRIPQEPGFGALIERLVNAPFSRTAAMLSDREGGYAALERARALGLVQEADDLTAAAWASHFAARGDAREKREREVHRAVTRHPFNFTVAAVNFDYALTAGHAALIGFAGLLAIVLIRAHRASRRTPDPPPSALWRAWRRVLALPRLVLAIAFGLATAGVLYGVSWLVVNDLERILVVAVLLIGSTTLLRIRPRKLIPCVTAAERRALAGAWAVLLGATIVLIDRGLVVGSVAAVPVGLFDGLGHPAVVAEFEGLLGRRGSDRPALRYAVAVANHLAGNFARAGDLYRLLPANYTNSAANRAALAAGRMPAATLTAAEIDRAWNGTRFDRWIELFRANEAWLFPSARLLLGATVAGLVLLLLMFMGPPPIRAENAPPSRFRKVAALLVPGVDDVRRGRPWRAWILLAFAGALVPVISAFAQHGMTVPGLGPLSMASLPNLASSFPLPEKALTWETWMAMTLSFPYAKMFFAMIAAAAIGALALHFSRVPKILREPVGTDERTVVASPALEPRS